jgi:DNA-binding NarL/FixJ family response regulator
VLLAYSLWKKTSRLRPNAQTSNGFKRPSAACASPSLYSLQASRTISTPSWTEQAGSRSVIILEHDTVLEESVALRIEGIVLRSVAAPQLVDCLHRVNAGERSVQRAKVKSMPSPDRVGVMVLQRLTPKELQIVALVAEGCKNKDIANQLGTKEQVVKNYLCSIYDKTGVSDRLELALFTIHHRALAEAVENVRASKTARTA